MFPSPGLQKRTTLISKLKSKQLQAQKDQQLLF